MKELFIFESNQSLRYQNKNLVVKSKDGNKRYALAIKQIKRLNIFGNPHITTSLLKALAINKKEVHYYSQNGQYIMSLNTPYFDNYTKQNYQFTALKNNNFSLDIAKKIIASKIQLQTELLKAYDSSGLLDQQDYQKFKSYYYGVLEATSIESILGFEGRSAKSYFYFLGLLVPYEFKFNSRSKRPPKDPFNALISFGYSILYGYVKGAIAKYGLNLGFSALHKIRKNHASLASDLMEEWRPIIVDDVVLQLIINKQLILNDFIKKDYGAVYLTQDARKTFLQALRSRMFEKHFYFGKNNKRFVFMNTVDQQIESLQRAFKNTDASLFKIITI